VSVADEPRRRVHQPADLLRLLFGLLGLGLAVGLADVAPATSSGVEQDIAEAATGLPRLIVDLGRLAAAVVSLTLPVGVVGELLYRRQGRRLLDSVLAAAVAIVLGIGFDAWVDDHGSATLRRTLTRTLAGAGESPAVSPHIAAVVAMVTASGLARRPGWRRTGLAFGLTVAVTTLVTGAATPLATVITLLLGWAAGVATRYVLGAPSSWPPAGAVLAALRRTSVDVTSLEPAPADASDGQDYLVRTRSGPILAVTVLHRDQQDAGLLYRGYRRLRVREPVARRRLHSLRESLEHEALLAFAAGAAGVRTPALVAAAEIGPDAALLAYEQVTGRAFADAVPGQLDDARLRAVWRQLRALHSRGVVHRGLTPDNLLIDAQDQVWLLGLNRGEIAASELAARLDTAQLLTTLALLVGPSRAVSTAVAELPAAEVARAVPMLQPLALSRGTRIQLRSHPQLLDRLRDELAVRTPLVDVAPMRIERLRPWTVLTVVAGAVAGYLLLSQLGSVDVAAVVARTEPGFTLLALAFSGLTYAGAALNLLGFTPGRLPAGRVVLAQLAASFVKLVAPAALGAVAVNARLLQRAGVGTGLAVASVGASQVCVLAVTVVVLAALGLLVGTGTAPSLDVPVEAVAALGAAAALSAAVLALPPSRRRIRERLLPALEQIVPRLLDVLQQPSRLAMGVGGALVQTGAFVLCLQACVAAFGGEVGLPTVAVVFLVGGTVGAAVPTPGGLGGTEAALAAGLVTAGLGGETAVSAVLLFRLATFWLPVLPGWAALAWLQRRGAL
jgi:glycosyltransferase 2 family protein